MKNFVLLTFLLGLANLGAAMSASGQDSTQIRIRKTADFQIDGTGDNAGWAKASWVPITIQESAGRLLATQTKMLYSDTGLYFLFQCEDQQLTATIQEDFGALFKEDVVEVFIWPDPSVPIYYEYELSPLNYELIILVPNINGRFHGWKPWSYKGNSRVQHATSVQGGEKKSGSAVKGWTAEFFIPYRLLSPMVVSPPTSGTQWRGNLYRIDYDQGYTTWSWQKTSGSFHEYKKFGVWIFE
ncbi:carbohydrate-binding family 9-like protein [Spirosoma taeanense]|uniref:Carbohydrate-binding family 9-like protein n=1 Tax=Spirosoma taeanense TaxID=2735870 RepID=A0A6M5Y9W4_9BACT|nr:carbohydrate-binding family 9-like protein [Spirosoma taeanense]QJW90003.1 carbohydrate-binding family 9-like protein [Spirosoma taeanense]